MTVKLLFIVVPHMMTQILVLATSEKLHFVKCVLAVQEDTIFMPPTDLLFACHGQKSDIFLKKKPIVPEHMKQPSAYGEKYA